MSISAPPDTSLTLGFLFQEKSLAAPALRREKRQYVALRTRTLFHPKAVLRQI